jgi:hypothetical protein
MWRGSRPFSVSAPALFTPAPSSPLLRCWGFLCGGGKGDAGRVGQCTGTGTGGRPTRGTDSVLGSLCVSVLVVFVASGFRWSECLEALSTRHLSATATSTARDGLRPGLGGGLFIRVRASERHFIEALHTYILCFYSALHDDAFQPITTICVCRKK